MSDAIEDYFHELDGRSRLPKRVTGTFRLDLEHDQGVDHWFVSVKNGQLHVSREERAADTVIRTAQGFFDRLVRGEERILPAWLRNDMVTEGTFAFLLLLRRLHPGRPGARHPRTMAGDRRRQS